MAVVLKQLTSGVAITKDFYNAEVLSEDDSDISS